MIKGAMILAVGFSLGYAKALHDQEDIRSGLAELVTLLKEHEQHTGQDVQKKDVVDGTAEETPNQSDEGDDVDER